MENFVEICYKREQKIIKQDNACIMCDGTGILFERHVCLACNGQCYTDRYIPARKEMENQLMSMINMVREIENLDKK